MKTKVKFLIHKDDIPTVFAYFPEDIWNLAGHRTSYEHIGQHGGCSEEYAQECIEAQPEEYNPLKNELETIGYQLEILN